MSELDSDALPAVESQMKKMMQPYLESQKVIQDFVDAHKSQFDQIARAMTVAQKTATQISEAINFSGIIDSYKILQRVSEQATAVLKIPQLPVLEPTQFGGLYANILEEQETLPYIVSNRRMGWQDKEDIALMVAEHLNDGRVNDGEPTKNEDEDICNSTIQQLGLLPDRSKGEVVVVVNGNYAGAFSVKYGKYWDLLIRIAEGERFRHQDIRGALDYFNTNGRCPLYTKGKHELTQILGRDYDFVVFKVSVEVLTQKAFQTRRNKTA